MKEFGEINNFAQALQPYAFQVNEALAEVAKNCHLYRLLREHRQNNQSIKEILKHRQMVSGLLSSDSQTLSFNNHVLATALLIEIYLGQKDDEIKRAIKKAVEFITKFILPNGDTLYVGEHAEEHSGYAALLFVLLGHFQLTGDSQSLSDAKKVFTYFRKNNDKSNDAQKAISAYYLNKSQELLKNINFPEEILSSANVGYRDEEFRKFATLRYFAIWSKPIGNWKNDLVFPYISYRSKTQTPPHSLREEDQSFPQLSFMKKLINWRKFGFSLWFGNTLVWISFFGAWLKNIKIKDDTIVIQTVMLTPFSSHDQITLDSTAELVNKKNLSVNDLKIISERDIEFLREGESPKGKTHIYRIGGKFNTLKISMY